MIPATSSADSKAAIGAEAVGIFTSFAVLAIQLTKSALAPALFHAVAGLLGVWFFEHASDGVASEPMRKISRAAWPGTSLKMFADSTGSEGSCIPIPNRFELRWG